MDPYELFDKERMALREELHNLKNCQITFLTSSVTATGAILGLATALASAPVLGVVFLFPLIVLLPSWWVFFDKATTITRIVGYYRVLEKLILGHRKATNFMGWENALGEFRKRQQNRTLSIPKEVLDNPWPHGLRNIILLRTAHPYWVISNYIFFALSGLCVVASILLLKDAWLLATLLPILLFIVSIRWNMRMVWNLIYGHHSYGCNEQFWTQILEVK